MLLPGFFTGKVSHDERQKRLLKSLTGGKDCGKQKSAKEKAAAKENFGSDYGGLLYRAGWLCRVSLERDRHLQADGAGSKFASQ